MKKKLFLLTIALLCAVVQGAWADANKGATWNTSITGNALFFPASGYRYYSSGSLYDVGSYGFYWSASPDGGNHGHDLGFGSGNWDWDYYSRAVGFPVRAVAEE